MTRNGSKRRLLTSYERNQILVLVVLALLLAGFFYYRWRQLSTQDEPDVDTLAGRLVRVEIAGDVEKPGVYEMIPGSKIADLLQQSGGSSSSEGFPETWRDLPLLDGTHVQVWHDTFGRPQMAVKRMDASTLGLLLLKMDLNEASVEDLKTLPGIGDVTARAIVDYRQAHGPFSSLEELKAVKGIGDSTVETLRFQVLVGRPDIGSGQQ